MTLKINGTSGSVSLDAPADTSPSGSDITLTLPTTVGSANQFVKNGSTAGTLEYSSLVEDSSGDVGLGIAAPTWTSGGGLHLGDNHGIGFGDGGNGRPDFQLTTTDGSRLDFRCGFGSDDADVAIDTSGRLLLGTTSARANFNDGGDSAHILLEGTTQDTSTLSAVRNSNNDGPAHLVLGKSRGGSANSTTVVQDGDTIGHINYEGADGSHLIRAGQISCVVDGTPGANDMPGSLRFSTCPNGSNSLIRRMQISNQGRVDIFATNLTDAHFISSAAGAGTSTDLITGKHSAGSIGAGTGCFAVKTNGNVVNTNNSYGSISDVKLKENIADASSQWDDLKAIQVRNYNFKEETGNPTHTQIGVVAQEIETVSPGLVYETPDKDDDGTDLGTTLCFT
mgnify:FL=1